VAFVQRTNLILFCDQVDMATSLVGRNTDLLVSGWSLLLLCTSVFLAQPRLADSQCITGIFIIIIVVVNILKCLNNEVIARPTQV